MRWKKSLSLFLRLLLFLCPLSMCAAQQQEANSKEIVYGLSQAIKEQLAALRSQSKVLKEQLRMAESESEQSSRQASELRAQLNDLNICLQSTNRKLAESSTSLTIYEGKLKRQRRMLAALWILLFLMAAVKAVIFFLKVKMKISLPYWLNVLL